MASSWSHKYLFDPEVWGNVTSCVGRGHCAPEDEELITPEDEELIAPEDEEEIRKEQQKS